MWLTFSRKTRSAKRINPRQPSFRPSFECLEGRRMLTTLTVTSAFLDWVYERAVADEGTNPGRTANKAREHLRAIASWAWELDLIESPPRFPKSRPQRDVAGRHYLTKGEINALYFATHKMERPRGWRGTMPVGRYWRCALVVFFNYGVDTGTVWKSEPAHEPILWRHVSWGRESPDREVKEQSPWGWLFYRRVKTGKAFYRPMNRVVHAHIKSIVPEKSVPRRSHLPWRRLAPERSIWGSLRHRRHQAQNKCRDRRR
jgi:hypothetical protein